MPRAEIALALLLAAAGCARIDPPGFGISCADGTTGRAVIGPRGMALTYAPGPAGGQAVAGLNQVVAASGVRWQGVEIELWEHQGEARLTAPGREPTACAIGP